MDRFQPLFFIRLAAVAFILVGAWLFYGTVEYIAAQRAFQAEGVQTSARIVGAHWTPRLTRRGGDKYDLTIAWTDTRGAQRTMQRRVPRHVYYSFALYDGTIIDSTDTILYVPSNPAIKPVMSFDDPGLPGGPLIGAVTAMGTGLLIAWFAFTPRSRRRGMVAILAGD